MHPGVRFRTPVFANGQTRSVPPGDCSSDTLAGRRMFQCRLSGSNYGDLRELCGHGK